MGGTFMNMDVLFGSEINFPVTYCDFLEDVRDSVFGQDEELENIVYDIYTYLRSLTMNNVAKHNFILTGPTACGKTEL